MIWEQGRTYLARKVLPGLLTKKVTVAAMTSQPSLSFNFSYYQSPEGGSRHVEAYVGSPPAFRRCIYVDRIAGGDCHHRRADWPALAGRAEGAGGGQPHQVLEQSQAARLGLPQLPRCQRHPAARRIYEHGDLG